MRHSSAALGLFALIVSGSVWAEDLNPQPLPPGRRVQRDTNLANAAPSCDIGSATTGAGAGKIRTEDTQVQSGAQAHGSGGAGKVALCANGQHIPQEAGAQNLRKAGGEQ